MRLPIAILALCLGVLPAAVRAAESQPYAGEVQATSLNLRAGPGESYQVVMRLKQGARVVVLGAHPLHEGWVQVLVPGGCEAWAYGRFIARKPGASKGTVLARRLLVRPRPTTRYHQLAGALEKGEQVEILGSKQTEEGLWLRIRVPERIPLFADGRYLRKIGPPELARRAPAQPEAGAEGPPAEKPAAAPASPADLRFVKLEPEIRRRLSEAKSTDEIQGLRRTLREIDRRQLSIENRERRVKLLADLVETEHKLAIIEVRRKEEQVKGDLDRRLKEIDRRYRLRLAEIRKEFEREKRSRYTATGIVEWAPDIFGRHPEFRLTEGGKMRYFLIAPDFDLNRFRGKRVGVVGIVDPESGTGYSTVMVKRIEILGER